MSQGMSSNLLILNDVSRCLDVGAYRISGWCMTHVGYTAMWRILWLWSLLLRCCCCCCCCRQD